MKIIKLTKSLTGDEVYVNCDMIQSFHKVGEGSCVIFDNYNNWHVKETLEEIVKLINE